MPMLTTIAARNLLHAGRRTFFLSLALTVVTALLVLLMALSEGVKATLLESATTLTSGHVNVGGFFKITSTRGIPRIVEAVRVRKIVEENTPGLDAIIDRQRGWVKAVGYNGSMQCGLGGIDIQEEERFRRVVRLASEGQYKEGGSEAVKGSFEALEQPDTALIFVNQAKRLGVGVGDVITLSTQTEQGVSNTLDVTVAAVAKNMGTLSDWNVYCPKETVDKVYRSRPGTTGAVLIYLKDVSKAEEVMGHLRSVLEKEGFLLMDHFSAPFFAKFDLVNGEDWVGQKLDLTVWSDEVSFFQWIFAALDSIFFFIIAILAFIIGIGIMNAMWISVRERTNEIGTLRAMGMSRLRVLALFLLESVVLGVGSSALGALLGAGAAHLMNAAHIAIPMRAFQTVLLSDTLHLSVQPYQIGVAVAAFTVITAVTALYPAYRASKLQPVTAIHKAG